MELTDDINKYILSMLKEHKTNYYDKSKIIHDSVLGTNTFQPYEITIIDLPIVQRLRRISQTDVASYVFPSGNHNRFEHTLGVATICGQLVNALFSKDGEQIIKETGISKEFVYQHVRVAAILHDCGHGPFSHLSEKYYQKLITDIKRENKELSKAKPHEILGYYIVRSTPLKEYFREHIEGHYGVHINLDFVSQIIVGHIEDPKKAFIVEIINGAFDADKLDYILRDSHATGLKMSLDIARLLYTVGYQSNVDGYNRLCVDISGVSTLEQVVFNKMLLTSSIYSHHKVRAAGCLLFSVFDEIVALGGLEIDGVLINFKSPVDFLYLTDDSIFDLDKNSPNSKVKQYVQMLKYRSLPKRALAISMRTCNKDHKEELNVFISFTNSSSENSDIIRKTIAEKITSSGLIIDYKDIWIDIPNFPDFKEAVNCIVKNPGDTSPYCVLRDVFPVDDWAKAFTENKWRGYFFAFPDNVEDVCKAGKEVLKEEFSLVLNEYANLICKIEMHD